MPSRCSSIDLRLTLVLGGNVFVIDAAVRVLDLLLEACGGCAAASASQRLAAYLMEQRNVQGALRIELPLATHQLAGHLGIRPETLSRIFGKWLQEGYVLGRGRAWELRALEALRRLADAEAAGLERVAIRGADLAAEAAPALLLA
jgi:hypothetical protein